VPAGQTLFLTVAPVSDMSVGFGSRVVGAMRMKDVVVHLPVTDR
jgi:ABC-2 type transport system ATP-binding protein